MCVYVRVCMWLLCQDAEAEQSSLNVHCMNNSFVYHTLT